MGSVFSRSLLCLLFLSLSAEPDRDEIPKVTADIENFFKKEVDTFIENRLGEIIKDCLTRDTRPRAIESCVFNKLPHRLFTLRNCRKNNLLKQDFTSPEEMNADITACLNKLRQDISQGVLPREASLEDNNLISPEEQAIKDAKNFLDNDADSFIKNRLEGIIKGCLSIENRPRALDSCILSKLPHKKFILAYCRKNNLLNDNFSTIEKSKADLVACVDLWHKEASLNSAVTPQIEINKDILTN